MLILRVGIRRVRNDSRKSDVITAFYVFKKDKEVILAAIVKNAYTQLASSFTIATFISLMMDYQWSVEWSDFCLIDILRDDFKEILN